MRTGGFLFSDACAERIFSPSFGTLGGSKPSGEFVVVVGDVEEKFGVVLVSASSCESGFFRVGVDFLDS